MSEKQHGVLATGKRKCLLVDGAAKVPTRETSNITKSLSTEALITAA